MSCKCFKCEKDMQEAGPYDAWEMPLGGVLFEGGWNYGSSLYDALADGIHVEVVICDDCLETAKKQGRTREMRKQTKTTNIPVEKNDERNGQ